MIYDISPVNNYVGNGLSQTFDFDFYIETSDELVVWHFDSNGNKTLLRYNIDYSINEFKNPNGSYITFPIAGSSYSVLGEDEKISLQLYLEIKQDTQYSNSASVNFKTLEFSFDYLTRICQILQRQLDRAVKVQETSDIATDKLSLDISKISDNINAISNVSSSISEITDLNENIEDVNSLAGVVDEIKDVSQNIQAVTSVAPNTSAISTVANQITPVVNVSENINSINTVSSSTENISQVASNITSVNNVSQNMEYVVEARQNAQSANSAMITAQNASQSAIQANSQAQTASSLASDWAVKMTGTVDGNEYSAKYYASVASAGQVNSDWEEDDPTSKAYILNKPDISTVKDTIKPLQTFTTTLVLQEDVSNYKITLNDATSIAFDVSNLP